MDVTERTIDRRWRGARAGWLAAVVASAVLVLAVASLAGCGSGTTTETQPEATETTSAGSTGGGGGLDFSGKTLEGADVSLSGYRGKPLVLAFMASW
jgi:hypothetical protein